MISFHIFSLQSCDVEYVLVLWRCPYTWNYNVTSYSFVTVTVYCVLGNALFLIKCVRIVLMVICAHVTANHPMFVIFKVALLASYLWWLMVGFFFAFFHRRQEINIDTYIHRLLSYFQVQHIASYYKVKNITQKSVIDRRKSITF